MNNLELLIKRAGFSKQEFARKRGVTPETLSRHMHGRINMTVHDAEKYAEILECDPIHVLFPISRVPVIGTAMMDYRHGSKDKTTVKRMLVQPPKYCLEIPDYYRENTCAMTWASKENYEGAWAFWKDAVSIYNQDPIQNNYVCKSTFQNMALCRLEEAIEVEGFVSDLIKGMVYPQPNGTYSIFHSLEDTLIEKVKLIWATPLLTVVMRPDLRRIKMVDL